MFVVDWVHNHVHDRTIPFQAGKTPYPNMCRVSMRSQSEFFLAHSLIVASKLVVASCVGKKDNYIPVLKAQLSMTCLILIEVLLDFVWVRKTTTFQLVRTQLNMCELDFL